MIRARAASIIVTIVLSALCAGCGQPAAVADQANNPMHVGVSDLELIRFQVANLLEEMFFVVEHPPRDPQRVDTRPLTSAHWFECWRPDTRTGRDVAENAVHTIRRQVTVHLVPTGVETTTGGVADGSGGTAIEVVVTKQRLADRKSVV